MSWQLTYDFFKDQGSALGAVATLAAVVVALFIGRIQSRDAKAVGDKQVAVVREQMRSLEQDRDGELKVRQRDLLRALGIEAARFKSLAHERLQVAQPNTNNAGISLTRDDRWEQFLIHTTDVMRASAGISELPGALLTPCTGLIASIDHLNSILGVRAKFGQLGWGALCEALEAIEVKADEVLKQAALAEDMVKGVQVV